MPRVILANKTTFNCSEEKTLLQAARLSGLVLEHSCRTGRCGVCKSRVASGRSIPLLPEQALSKREMEQGFILTCCRTAETDLSLDIEDLGELGALETKTLPCRIDNLERIATDVMHVTLRTPPTTKFEYLPGQYLEVIGKDGIRRSYSVANAPREDGKLTLQIRRVELGVMSRYWFEEAKINDLLRLEGPLGTFCLRNSQPSQLIFLATGTGIAPIKAILEEMAAKAAQYRHNRIHLYWGGRVPSDIYWKPNFPSLNLTFTPVLSRAGESWQGRTGYIQQAALEDGISLEDAAVYACGSEAMIQSAHTELSTAGLLTKDFYSDAFVSSN